MRSRSVCALMAAALAGGSGCAARSWSEPPPGWVPTQAEARRHDTGFGDWGIFIVRGGEGGERTGGELVAVGPDSLYVLTPVGVRALPTPRVQRVAFVEFIWKGGGMERKQISGSDLDAMRRHARFPQGLPPGSIRARCVRADSESWVTGPRRPPLLP